MTPKWEYKVLKLKTDFGFWSGTEFDADALQAELNRLGSEGWEVVSIFDIEKVKGGSKYVNVVLKRFSHG
jgi:Domain of unknown function (DUF4177)